MEDAAVMERMIDSVQATFRRRRPDGGWVPSRDDCAAALGAALLTMRQLTSWPETEATGVGRD